ncbi:unnamed protein product (macronuclear) [Paramecium tetraurelia]|uniref:14-3-3 domain-containing protein n=1 Tax=Paramecium tetraurelia TaxID=5888 RepID=A0DKD3_PARTE|nr:uncharacterized protein GSPATT00017829001 [Paramecium tetraurelia]CAK83500.1 unnamed protein product [Paramecium tetraurelia]|eukprot:XP_001450897.1 hypothetical protein (macronuclear) [Paramecium tetraurelia strain d4-2]
MSSRDELLYMARLTEQTERFEDMVNYIKQLVSVGQELSVEERNLLSVAYKNSIGGRRTAWRVLSSIENKEEGKVQKSHFLLIQKLIPYIKSSLYHYSSQRNLTLIRSYKKKIEQELNGFCNDVLNLIDTSLIRTATNSEAKVFYYKMKGDYHRYISEYSSGDQHKQAADGALEAYQQASNVANSELKTTNPIRLGLALNFSVFYYEVLNDPTKACSLAKQAFDDAIADIEQIEESQYKDATTIMQLIRDNLTLWTSELEDEEGPK